MSFRKTTSSARSQSWTVLFGIVVYVFVLWAGVGANGVLAQEIETEEKEDLANYAFAAHLGTGIYRASGRTVQVYSLPMSYTLRPVEDNNWGVKLKFPVTVGFFDFKARDIIDSGPPDDVATITVLPGVEFQFPLRDNWFLMPFGDLGGAKDYLGGELAYIYSAGIKSRVVFPWKDFEFSLGNRFLYAGYTATGADFSDDFRSFETGLDVKRPLGFNIRGRQADLSVYFVNYLYSNLAFLRFRDDSFEVHVQYELGFTLGTTTTSRFWVFEIPRIGLGYRFGDGLQIIRLVLGMPF